jgi:hypothetical protein
MQTLPIASFLAGALLTITMPAGLFLVLTYLYMRFLRRAPEAANPGPPTIGPAPSHAPSAEAAARASSLADPSGDAKGSSQGPERPARSLGSPSPPAEP